MALQSFLALVGGKFSRIFPVQSSTGSASAGAIPALNAAGAIDVTMLPSGVEPDTTTATASEAIAAGAPVNLWSNGGVASVRNANGATSLEAQGYIISAAASGATGVVVYLNSVNTALSGLTPGTDYFLSDTTAGAATATAPTTTGHYSQQIGYGTAAGNLQFNPGPMVSL